MLDGIVPTDFSTGGDSSGPEHRQGRNGPSAGRVNSSRDMYVLVINSGSSTIKFKVYEADTEALTAWGMVDRIGAPSSHIECRTLSRRSVADQPIPTHAVGLHAILEALVREPVHALSSLDEICAVGHRAVHGGDLFTGSVIVNGDVIAKLRECSRLAPLHNPPNLLGIIEMQLLLPSVPQVAVFDTAFHQTIPPQTHLYALPYPFYEKHRVRRYGFHGTSYRFVSARAAELLRRPLEKLRMVVCHLGNGASMAAIREGHSVDTTMGFTPLEGLMMGTRSGDLDPGVVLFLQRELGLTVDEIDNLLNDESGLAGVSGAGNDLRDIQRRALEGDERCQLAIDMYCYRIRKYVGAYAAAMGGIDALVFTGGIGENSAAVREQVCRGLEFLGVRIDVDLNTMVRPTPTIISRDRDSPVCVMVIPSDEEIVILRDTIALTRGGIRRVAPGRPGFHGAFANDPSAPTDGHSVRTVC